MSKEELARAMTDLFISKTSQGVTLNDIDDFYNRYLGCYTYALQKVEEYKKATTKANDNQQELNSRIK